MADRARDSFDPPPTYDDIFTSSSEQAANSGPEAAGGEGGPGGDNWSEDELSTAHPFSGTNLFSSEAEPDSEAPGGLIFPDLPNIGGGVGEVTGLFGSQSIGDDGVRGVASAGLESSTASQSSSQDTAPVSVIDPLPHLPLFNMIIPACFVWLHCQLVVLSRFGPVF